MARKPILIVLGLMLGWVWVGGVGGICACLVLVTVRMAARGHALQPSALPLLNLYAAVLLPAVIAEAVAAFHGCGIRGRPITETYATGHIPFSCCHSSLTFQCWSNHADNDAESIGRRANWLAANSESQRCCCNSVAGALFWVSTKISVETDCQMASLSLLHTFPEYTKQV